MLMLSYNLFSVFYRYQLMSYETKQPFKRNTNECFALCETNM